MPIKALLDASPLRDIAAKVEAGERLNRDDGVRLMQTDDLLSLGYLADRVRRRKVGDAAYFINNYHINHTTVCYAGCTFCAFARHEGDEGAYTLSLDEIAREVEEKAKPLGVSEIHIIGGLNPNLAVEYYFNVVRAVRQVMPDVHIQAYDATEVNFIAAQAGMSLKDCLLELQAAGMGSLMGGGAEVLVRRVREEVCPGKETAERWLGVHRTAHQIGMKSNASIMHGHVETPAERIEHLLRIRELQDETGGFQAFFPMGFYPENTYLGQRLQRNHLTSGYDDLRMLATARLLLDNVAHIRSFWVMLGMKMAQVSLAWGVDDLDGTVRSERIIHDAGATTPQEAGIQEMVRLIRQAGRVPLQRDTLYNVIRSDF